MKSSVLCLCFLPLSTKPRLHYVAGSTAPEGKTEHVPPRHRKVPQTAGPALYGPAPECPRVVADQTSLQGPQSWRTCTATKKKLPKRFIRLALT